MVTGNWLREGIGHLLERMANVAYGALVFSISRIVSESLIKKLDTNGILVAMPVNFLILGAAILYRGRIFNRWVRPVADKVRYGNFQSEGGGEESGQQHLGRPVNHSRNTNNRNRHNHRERNRGHGAGGTGSVAGFALASSKSRFTPICSSNPFEIVATGKDSIDRFE